MENITVKWNGPYDFRFDGLGGREHDWGVYQISRRWGPFPERVLYIGHPVDEAIELVRSAREDTIEYVAGEVAPVV